ncbi:hypothetical protein BASA61_006135 [Batrachochytrium salamandrivorans]|nr:hypothetical protein BASA62_008429 [Batrachochytrium salamandrivorans]KAH6569929.1 hypothetical protein BASA60_008015 [Batrachochytrium salamandrivorans]KAH6587986.1 hypothetical protein BASA61_006135 [Batrachochytrium salamandrivorans]
MSLLHYTLALQTIPAPPPMHSVILAMVGIGLVSKTAHAFIASGARIYRPNETIPVFFSKATSDKTHLLAAYDELPFVCSPSELSHQLLSIGQILRGDRVIKSDIVVRTMVQTPCELLCSKPIHQVDVALARHMIQDNYQVEWILDDLPGATAKSSVGSVTIDKRYEIGFPLGYYNQKLDVFELHNHLLLNIVYKEYSRDNIVIVGFEIYPKSIQTASGMCLSGRDSQYMDPFYLPESGHTTIDWTYSVQWQHDDTVDWPHRWDKYLTTRTTSIHWYSVANSIVILLLMTAAVAAAMMHTLSRDISFYNNYDAYKKEKIYSVNKDGVDDTVGWKALHGDVFRPTPKNHILAALVGASIQLLFCALFIIFAATCGIISPTIQGGIISTGLISYCFGGYLAGYAMAVLHKAFRGFRWRGNAFMTSSIVPAVIIGIWGLLNIGIWWYGLSLAIPFGAFVILASMWSFISLPLVWLGARAGFFCKVFEFPTRCCQVPRQIPIQPWYLDPFGVVIAAGAFPFAVIFVELYFVLDVIWKSHHVHYLFGCLIIVATLLVLTCIEVSVVITYLTLSAEDYRWQWRAFMTGGSAGIYVLFYLLSYYAYNFDVDSSIPGMMFFAYSLIGCFIFSMCTGTVGYLSSLVFVCHIYSSIKID